ncbi:FKBP-type peptidyl-prolyl cis-trans isomerase [Vaginella massiliensis]|uniref:FKBP-type peptidyl-prolyl cis-trans isomerase n=1 Tax=Vaginella massiliensis TaxID=1816680 RepID=UPI0008380730|nr:FKBP-type peptidyl-prolyl cis-trans isomerase [Vaginella massiliensis]
MGVAEILLKRKKELAEKNKNEGNAFREEFAKHEGVVTLESGLQYQILVEGDGPKPKESDTVLCHYHGTTIHNEVFDSSVQRQKPASFPLNRVIAGWTEALQLMPVGSKWKLVIPAELAYGEEQISKAIGPNSTLIFEVELLGIL